MSNMSIINLYRSNMICDSTVEDKSKVVTIQSFENDKITKKGNARLCATQAIYMHLICGTEDIEHIIDSVLSLTHEKCTDKKHMNMKYLSLIMNFFFQHSVRIRTIADKMIAKNNAMDIVLLSVLYAFIAEIIALNNNIDKGILISEYVKIAQQLGGHGLSKFFNAIADRNYDKIIQQENEPALHLS